MTQTIGIAGFTGKFARCVVKSILQYPGVSVRGFCRDPSKLPPSVTTLSRIHIVKGEFNDKNALHSFVTGTDVVIYCYLGNEELMSEGQKLLIDVCVANNVPRYSSSKRPMQRNHEISRVERYSGCSYPNRSLYGDILERLYANLGPKAKETLLLGYRP